MAYIKSFKNQNWLFPLSIKDMICENHICFLVEEFTESQDFSYFDKIYKGSGAPAYHPRILLKILLYGMLSQIRSSRKLSRACHESFVFLYLSEKLYPDFRTISRFRKENANFIKQTFKSTIELASNYNLIDLTFLSIDGSMLKANVSKKRTVTKEELDILDKAIDKIFDEDLALDELEDELYGNNEEFITSKDKRDIKQIIKEYRDKQKAKEQIKKARDELDKNSLKKVCLTDIDCRFMQNKKKVAEPSFNVQISSSNNHFILSNDVCNAGHDAHQFIP